jgi:ubiquinone biosynthesis protein
MVGQLSPQRRDEVTDLLFALVERDSERASNVLCSWDDDVTVAPERLSEEIAEYLDEYHGLALKDVPIGEILANLLGLLRTHDLTLPADLSLLFKILLTLENFGRQLDPEFNLAAESRPFLERTLRRRYSPHALRRRSWKATRRLIDLFTTLPEDIGELLGSTRRGRLQLRVRVTDLERLSTDLSRAANRATVGLVTSALIVGTSFAMTVNRGPRLFDLPVFGFLGFVSSFIAGVWLLGSIWRSRRTRYPPAH